MPFPTVNLTPGSGATVNTLPNAGQAVMAESLSVTVASNQSAVPVSAASLPLPSGAATSAKQPALGTAGAPSADVITVQGNASGTAMPVSGTVTANLGTIGGASTAANQSTVITDLGAVTETAPASDTASSGLNGRLQRIAQRLTSLIALIPASLGQKTMANSLAVAVASDQGAVPVSAASLPLPSGAATAANQPSAAAQGSTTSGQTGTLAEAAVTTGSPSYTTGQTSPLSLDTSGNLRVNVVTGGGAGGTSSNFSATFPSAGTAIGVKNGANMVNLTADGSGNLNVLNAAGENIIGIAAGIIANPTSVLTRPADATAYAQNDLIASNTTAGSITVPSATVARLSAGNFMIRRLRLATNVTTGWDAVTLAIRLWTAAPIYTNGDNGAYAVATGAAGFLGQFNVALTQFGDGAAGIAAPSIGSEAGVDLASGQVVYWDIQYTGSAALTPISAQTFTLTPEVFQN